MKNLKFMLTFLIFNQVYSSESESWAQAKDLYLDLMKKILINLIYKDDSAHGSWNSLVITKFDPAKRLLGQEWPTQAHTMIGLKRLCNLQECIEDVLKNNIKGDFIETGVWRGGATIFMNSILKIYDQMHRKVYVADSFQGLPEPDLVNYPQDAGIYLSRQNFLAVSLDEVRANFDVYGLLTDNVIFLKGWFKDTLPVADISRLAIVRLDGDLYESTMDALKNLYPKLSVGGYLIIDDYFMGCCAQAVQDYRKMHDIRDEILEIDGAGVYWKKTKEVGANK